MKRKILSIMFVLVLALTLTLVPAVPAAANNIASSTMYFEETGALIHQGGGVYTGTIDMAQGTYYNTGGAGYGQRHGCTDTSPCATPGGFDLYAKLGATAYVSTESPDSWTIGSDHDAYSDGGPWGTWYTPDCADWCKYELELTEDHWYLRYKATSESPMSGTMDWNAGYAAETDKGTVDGTDPTQYTAGSAQEWGWDCGWGEERIPLQYPGFDLVIGGTAGHYTVTLTPAAAGATQLTVEVPDIVAISVNPTSIDFGSLVPGQTSSAHDIVATNVGTHQVKVDADVSGSAGDLFFDNLELKNYTIGSPDWSTRAWNGWPSIITGLAMDNSETLRTKVQVPPGYTPAGPETAQLTFTATGT